MIRQVEANGEILAIIIPHNFSKDGIEFFTPNEFSQQMGYMKRPKGYEIEPHIHKLALRKISLTQEVIFVKQGRIQVDLYDQTRKYIANEVLETGDIILLASGGHGFVFLEESELVEVKQGPYLSFEKDKERFEKAIPTDS